MSSRLRVLPALAVASVRSAPKRVTPQNLPALATLLVCLLLYTAASIRYPGFLSARVFLNFLSDNAFLGITAVGLTFVILSGGIDLSVGAAIGCTSILIAVFVGRFHMHPMLAIAAVLVLGVAFGAAQGSLIRYYGLPPFLVTLGGLFFCRGVGLWVSTESIQIAHPFYARLTEMAVPLGPGLFLPLGAILFLLVLVVGVYVSLYTPFGRNTYAIGGGEPSAVLMGLPVGRTKVGIYALNGFCSALAGVAYTLYTSSGNATAGVGLELDAIAAVVVGGTLLSGGTGYVASTFLGVLIFGIIKTAIAFEGTLSSWWTKIAVGLLLLVFILLQRLIQRRQAHA